MKLNKIAIAIALVFPLVSNAQTSAQLQSEIEALKAQVKELQELIKGKAATAAEEQPVVELEEFNRIKTKVEAAEDVSNVNGMKGLRISGGLDTVYIWNQAKNTSSFVFGNNYAPSYSYGSSSGEMFSYDNSYFGMAYLDIQKEMEGGTKLRLTLAPTKSNASAYNMASIINEASASIPLTDSSTRLMIGQMPDVSGYEPILNTYTGTNSISSNQLYPASPEYFVTKNLLSDFTAATMYTGVGLDLVRGPWETKLFLANFNAPRNDITANTSTDGGMNSPAFIFNSAYTQEEFWGFEFTGYLAKVANPVVLGTYSQLAQFEIDGNYTRGDFNGNLQLTTGQFQNAAFGGGDAEWYGFSALASERLTPQFTLAGRLDFLYDQANGGGVLGLGNTGVGATYTGGTLGDFVNGFGPGDPNASDYDPKTGSNRTALTVAGTYRINPNVSLRSELRRDYATRASFYNYNVGSFQNSNTTLALQAVVNF